MNQTYEKLDVLIIKAISEGHRFPMYSRDVADEALRIARATWNDDFFVLSDRLRALSNSGVIRYFEKPEAPEGKAGWYVMPKTG
jgi:hypothetical protein